MLHHFGQAKEGCSLQNQHNKLVHTGQSQSYHIAFSLLFFKMTIQTLTDVTGQQILLRYQLWEGDATEEVDSSLCKLPRQ